jgi:hypothetical protein
MEANSWPRVFVVAAVFCCEPPSASASAFAWRCFFEVSSVFLPSSSVAVPVCLAVFAALSSARS